MKEFVNIPWRNPKKEIKKRLVSLSPWYDDKVLHVNPSIDMDRSMKLGSDDDSDLHVEPVVQVEALFTLPGYMNSVFSEDIGNMP